MAPREKEDVRALHGDQNWLFGKGNVRSTIPRIDCPLVGPHAHRTKMGSQVYLNASALPDSSSHLYPVRTDGSSLSMAMPSNHILGLIGLAAAAMGVIAVAAAGAGLFGSTLDWSGALSTFTVGAVFLVAGVWLTGTSIDLRTVTCTYGRATVVWSLLGRPIRSSTIDLQSVVVQHDLWRAGNASTDSVVLEGQGRTHRLATLWNVPPAGTYKPPFNNWSVGPASQIQPQAGTTDERTVSPLILGLAKSLAGAASVPIVLRIGEGRGPWITIGDD